MAERDAQFLQIGLGHVGQDVEIDGVLGKDGRVLPEPDLIEPSRYPVIGTHCRASPIPQAPVAPAVINAAARQANWSGVFPSFSGWLDRTCGGSSPSEPQQYTARWLWPM